MRKIISIVALLVLTISRPILVLANVPVQKGTEIEIIFPQEVNGSKLKKGDEISFKIAKDYYSSGKLVFKANDQGSVTVLNKRRKGFILPNAGSFKFGRGYIKASNGQVVSIISKGEEYKGHSVAKNPAFWASFIIWPLIFVPMTREGKILAGTKTSVRISKNTSLNI